MKRVELTNTNAFNNMFKVLRPTSEEQNAAAAVALMMKPLRNGFKVLFVKRVENSSDPWSGQIAFPGGKHEAKDQNLLQTVIRETFEETGINLLDCCNILGVTKAFRSTRKPELKVLPFIVQLDGEVSIKLNQKELESHIWISLEELQNHKGTAELDFGVVPAYKLGKTIIWGLTYRILEHFFQIIEPRKKQEQKGPYFT
ncbi:MAG: CoA pyrophosphatase [Candidatus Bathyarchaeota archaeon]